MTGSGIELGGGDPPELVIIETNGLLTGLPGAAPDEAGPDGVLWFEEPDRATPADEPATAPEPAPLTLPLLAPITAAESAADAPELLAPGAGGGRRKGVNCPRTRAAVDGSAPLPDPPRGGSAAPPPARATGCQGFEMPWLWAESELGALRLSQSSAWGFFAGGATRASDALPPPPPAAR